MLLSLVAATLLQTASSEPIFEGLGDLHRKVSTKSPVCQKYFDQGLAFLFAFNHDESIRSFKAAAAADPNCAMAYWGIATANGPHINNPMVDPEHSKEALAALKKADAATEGNSVERQLISAAGKRFADNQPNDRSKLDRAYADAMRQVWKNNPHDADIGAMFAESMMDLRPWDLWKHDETPQPGTMEIIGALRAAIKLSPNHPLANHLYIHAVEASPHPEWGMASADKLRFMQPGLGHMVHMPSHIDVRTGEWQKAIAANQRAIATDKAYRTKVPNQGFYRVYMAHNQHMLAFAAMMRGESKLAISEVDSMLKVFPDEWLKDAAPLVDGFVAMPIETRVRFGKWQEVLDMPEMPDYFPISRALRHSARATAYAALGQASDARYEQSQFLAARKKVPEGASFGNNSATNLLDTAEHLMNGEILLGEKKTDASMLELKRAVYCEDQLRYDEPPDWIQPTRHTLGAVLLSAGKFAEAEKVYKEDLKRLPANGWSLFGLSEALKGEGRSAEARTAKTAFDKVWANADIKIGSSCLCVPGN